MKALLITLFIFCSSLSKASTFVGNGGNVGDVELQMTLQQLSQTFDAISRNEDDVQKDLCVCTETYEGRPLCDVLKRLTPPQVRFCSRFLQTKAAEMRNGLQQKERIQFTWTHQPIEVREGGRLRAADAVTNISDMSMTIHQKSFVDMNPDERAFLIGHELFHLTTFQGKPLSDEGPVGPFNGESGSRQLINAMAASLVMTAKDIGAFRLTEPTLNRSKASENIWIDFAYNRFEVGNNRDNAYSMDALTGSEFGLRYQFDTRWGVYGQYRNLRNSRKRLTQIECNEYRNIFSVGVAYRWFPKDNPLTFWGQSHAIFSASVDQVNAKYELHDISVGMDESVSGTGFTVGARYYIPFKHSFWGYGGLMYSNQNLKFPILEAQYTGGLSSILGVSYGF